ncbi:tRNA (N6-threonylcarbamoyladenosine(37)-N6)-methyltransferase TrmO [Desulfatiferula olefinivorans]
MVELHPIGVIRTPFQNREGMPIQPTGAEQTRGTVELMPQYVEGLNDLDGFSHIILLYQFHLSDTFTLTVTPFMDTTPRGLFATRAPRRPNPIGLSIVRLTGVRGPVLDVEGIDVVDKTPLLDIKPYVPVFDLPRGEVRSGWVAASTGDVQTRRADNRFI